MLNVRASITTKSTKAATVENLFLYLSMEIETAHFSDMSNSSDRVKDVAIEINFCGNHALEINEL